MQTTHVLSDLLLAITGVFVFYRYLAKLHLHNTVLWESFVLSVVGAAIFGAIAFAGYKDAFQISEFFQNLASITGGVGVAAAAIGLVANLDFGRTACYLILTLGFLLYVLSAGFGLKMIDKWVPMIAMGIVVIAALYGLLNKKYNSSAWLLVAVAFFAFAQFRHPLFGHGDNIIDLYHILLAGGLLALGMANQKK